MRKAPVWLLATAVAILVPALAAGKSEEFKWSPYEQHYLGVYEKCFKAFGPKCGRNLLDAAWKDGSSLVPQDRVVASSERMTRWLNPPPPPPEPVATADPAVTSAPTPAPPTVAASSGGCPSYMSGEASSPGAVNPSSGASGCYQVTPDTAANYGAACSDVNASSCVAAICAGQGNAAWQESGATPCDYLSQP